jgi:hypothetical protein
MNKHVYLLYTINPRNGTQLLMGVTTRAQDVEEWEDSISLNKPSAVEVELNAMCTDFEKGLGIQSVPIRKQITARELTPILYPGKRWNHRSDRLRELFEEAASQINELLEKK